MRPTMEVNGVEVNGDRGLEGEADVMGKRAVQMRAKEYVEKQRSVGKGKPTHPQEDHSRKPNQIEQKASLIIKTVNKAISIEDEKKPERNVLPSENETAIIQCSKDKILNAQHKENSGFKNDLKIEGKNFGDYVVNWVKNQNPSRGELEKVMRQMNTWKDAREKDGNNKNTKANSGHYNAYQTLMKGYEAVEKKLSEKKEEGRNKKEEENQNAENNLADERKEYDKLEKTYKTRYFPDFNKNSDEAFNAWKNDGKPKKWKTKSKKFKWEQQ
ncbi:MAG: hypothetical protein F6K56_36575 [Moorea sp. SIO3G5]|nr:hypothetical protein [Moorena sp. SIO3G5]